jgi:hypothetical protein
MQLAPAYFLFSQIGRKCDFQSYKFARREQEPMKKRTVTERQGGQVVGHFWPTFGKISRQCKLKS